MFLCTSYKPYILKKFPLYPDSDGKASVGRSRKTLIKASPPVSQSCIYFLRIRHKRCRIILRRYVFKGFTKSFHQSLRHDKRFLILSDRSKSQLPADIYVNPHERICRFVVKIKCFKQITHAFTGIS